MNESITLTYMPLQHEELPVQKAFRIDGNNYIFHFDYNTTGDFYTLQIIDDNGNPIYTSKLTYLENAIHDVVSGLDLKRKIVPLNISDAMKNIPSIERIGASNFDSMRLCIV